MADVKFSELSELAAADVASDDILAVVDTTASTSKKLTINSLFGEVPVNIAVNDTTDTSSATTGSIQTDGGIGIAKKLWVGTTLSVGTTSTLTGASTLTGEVTVGTGLIADTQGGAYLGSSAKQFSSLFLHDAGTIALGDDGDVVLTHVPDAAVMLNAAMAMRWRDATLGVNSSVDGQLDIYADAELEVTAPIVDIDASTGIALDGANLNSTWTVNAANKIQWRDTGLYINSSTNGQLDVVADVEAQIVAPTVDIDASTGIALDGADLISAWTVGTTNKIQFRDTGIFIQSSVDGQIDIEADAELEITSPIVDIDASTGIALDGANLNSNWLVNTTNQIQFHDTAQYIYAPANARLAVVSDGPVEVTSTMLKVGLASQDGNIQALTDAYDMTLKQFDGVEVARVFDGAKALTDTDAATVKPGFGYRRPVIGIDVSAATKAVTLTDAESGALISVKTGHATYTATVTLPAVGVNSEGVFFDFVSEVVSAGGSLIIACADTASKIDAYYSVGATQTIQLGAGDVMTCHTTMPKGARIRCTAVIGSATASEVLWMIEVRQIGGTAPVVA